MKAFRIKKGDSSRVIALDNPGVLNAIITCIDTPNHEEETIYLNMGGLDCSTDQDLHWDQIDLEVGDQVIVEVIEDCQGDEPDEISSKASGMHQDQVKEYIRENAAKLGWTIIENNDTPEHQRSTPS